MRLRRLRAGEWLAAAGTVALAVLLFFGWFEEVPPPGGGALALGDSTTGWGGLGWALDALLAVVIALAAWLVVTTASDAPVSQPVMAGVLLSALAPVALIALVVRVAIAQPGTDRIVEAEPAAYAGVLALALVVAGAWRSLADERTDAAQSAYTPPPPRPAPPERI